MDEITRGSDTRPTILGQQRVSSSNSSLLGTSYKPGDAMLTPPQIGVHVGNGMGDVINAVKGVGFYVDQIGFGAPSTGLTQGMNLRPLGVNYFIKTGKQCSNGADMWQYMAGIPDGNALGERIKITMQEMGLPSLRGLAPGMLEDAQHALNPAPLMNAAFGSGYPQCKQVTLPVGDSYGRIYDSTTGDQWITDPQTAVYNGGGYVQTKWVQDTDYNGDPINITRDEWVATPKIYNRNGTLQTNEGFSGFLTRPETVITVGILCILAFAVVKKR